jgi:hypothetical protein
MTSHRIWREPFLHFTLLGVLIFAADAWLRDRSDAAGSGEIVVTAGRIENLSAVFARTWQRPPTAEELRGLVDSYVLDEAMFREGVALGVDQDDAVIRRRVRQKMEFFVDEIAGSGEASDEELEAWLAENAQTYVVPAQFTFQQVYLNPDSHGEALAATAESLLEQLRAAETGVDAAALGDRSLLDSTYTDFRADMVARSFGQVFVDQLAELPTGEWSGPVQSGYGFHLVYVDSVTPARAPVLAEVRGPVERDWRRTQREAATDLFYQQTVERYDVTIEWAEFADILEEAGE